MIGPFKLVRAKFNRGSLISDNLRLMSKRDYFSFPTVYQLSKALPSYLVVSIDYRLAPAHPYPAALEDIDVAYKFLIEHAASYKIDLNRIVIAGDSAGGNLAAAYCLKLRDTNRNAHLDDVIVMPKLQVGFVHVPMLLLEIYYLRSSSRAISFFNKDKSVYVTGTDLSCSSSRRLEDSFLSIPGSTSPKRSNGYLLEPLSYWE